MAIKARGDIEDLFIGKLSTLTNLINKPHKEIMIDIKCFSKDEKSLQLTRMLETDAEPLIILDQEGHLGAITLEKGEIKTAVRPTWLKAITIYRHARTLAYGDESKNEGIDRNAYRRKSRFQNQAIRNETNYSKAQFYGKRKMEW